MASMRCNWYSLAGLGPIVAAVWILAFIPGTFAASSEVPAFPVRFRLDTGNNQRPDDLIIYDGEYETKARITLAPADKPGIWEASTQLKLGPRGFRQIKIRVASFVKDRGWHYRFNARITKTGGLVQLQPRKVPAAHATSLVIEDLADEYLMEYGSLPMVALDAPVIALLDEKPKPGAVPDSASSPLSSALPSPQPVIPGDPAVLIRLQNEAGSPPPEELVLYDPAQPVRDRLTLVESAPGSGRFEARYPLRPSQLETGQLKVRVASFIKDRGWHYRFTWKRENGLWVLLLNPKKVQPESSTTLPLRTLQDAPGIGKP